MTKRTTTKPNEPTAAGMYAAQRSDIARLLDVLAMELEKRDDAAKADPGNWGKACDLALIRSDLANIVAFASGMERDEVERFLREAE
ncbi:MAG: hypothetical protein H6813_02660 [Phycisphaeraceae bacterium]|nr:hypothetical protein [Phycisphaeraceae bacterium]MCB9848782.1 hypothetical protein [Phycisphaeraceae bacterium]